MAGATVWSGRALYAVTGKYSVIKSPKDDWGSELVFIILFKVRADRSGFQFGTFGINDGYAAPALGLEGLKA